VSVNVIWEGSIDGDGEGHSGGELAVAAALIVDGGAALEAVSDLMLVPVEEGGFDGGGVRV